MTELGYTLGLDIGIASVGAAVIKNQRIEGLFVRAFDAAEESKEGESLNKKRRESRLMRRRFHRRSTRMRDLLEIMHDAGLIDHTSLGFINQARYSVWQSRALGLDQLLEREDWASVIYHIVKHRGFLSTRKSERTNDEETGKMLAGISENKRRMGEGGYRTLGEMAFKHSAFIYSKRNKAGSYSHTFNRVNLKEELASLFLRQRELGNNFSGIEFERKVIELLMFQRKSMTFTQMQQMVGKCVFEPREFRAPKASYRAERFVWLTKLNNLRVLSNGTSRALSAEERFKLIELPFSQNELKFSQVRKVLQLSSSERFNGLIYKNEKDPEKAVFFEAKAFHKLRKAYQNHGLHSQWQRDSQDANRLDDLAYAQTYFKSDDEARVWLASRQIENEIVEAALEVSFDKFIMLSQKALTKILPHMEQGQRYDEAVQSAGYEHHSQIKPNVTKQKYLSAPNPENVRNPVVYRSLNQARKLVNAIIRRYGAPSAVHIELARDLTKPFDERRQIHKGQEQFRKEKLNASKNFFEELGSEPNSADLLKYRLYREQDGKCAYSQKPIDLRLLLSSEVEIDHILPRSRSFDNSLNNKVLVLIEENRNKGNRTPYEFLGGSANTARWQQFKLWVEATKSIRQAKRNRLLMADFGATESKFRERNLNDTRYICVEFKRMIETQLQWHPNTEGAERCVVLSGQLTANLRAHWGLIKDRAQSDLHHALDAAVIAATNRSLVKRMSDYVRRGELRNVRERYVDPTTGEIIESIATHKHESAFPIPWQGFREELLEKLQRVRVSRAPLRRGSGAAHEETIRSVGKREQWLAQGKSAVKTPLSKIHLKDLTNIVGGARDAKLIAAIRERLEAHGDDPKKAFAEPLYKPSMDGKIAPIVRSVNLFSDQKSGLRVRGGIANNATMLRLDVFEKGGKFFAVPLYVADAGKAKLPSRAAIANKPESEWIEMDTNAGYRFLFSLHKNDWIVLRMKNGEVREGYYSTFNRHTAALDIVVHDRNKNVGDEGTLKGNGIKTAAAIEKWHVDMLGGLHRASPETRQPLRAHTKMPKTDIALRED